MTETTEQKGMTGSQKMWTIIILAVVFNAGYILNAYSSYKVRKHEVELRYSELKQTNILLMEIIKRQVDKKQSDETLDDVLEDRKPIEIRM